MRGEEGRVRIEEGYDLGCRGGSISIVWKLNHFLCYDVGLMPSMHFRIVVMTYKRRVY